MSQNQGNNTNADVLQRSSGVRNQYGGSTQGMCVTEKYYFKNKKFLSLN